MKKLLFIFLFILINNVTNAQTAKEWMDKLSETYSKVPTYYIKFEIKESGNPEAETGEIFAAKDKFNLDVMGINQIYDGKNLYTVSKEDKEVTLSNPEPGSDDLLTPTKVLNLYKTGYVLSLDKTATVSGNSIQYIKLKPTQSTGISSILVGIKKSDNTLYEYKETYTEGGTRTITVKDYLENLIIPRTLFKFDESKYKNDGYIVTRI